jgi:DNA polymerase-3 subunit epsilon
VSSDERNPWHRDGPILCWDLETTGVDVNFDRIVTCTAALVRGSDVQIRSWLVSPGIPIPTGATAIHGISTEQAMAEGVDPGEAVAQIVTVLDQAVKGDYPVVGFNLAYDATLFDRECRRYGVTNVEPFMVDGFVLDKHLDPYRRGKRTLTATCAHYHVALDGAHDATQDALAAGRVAWRMAESWPKELQIPLADLHTQQAMWRHNWAQEFQEYLRVKKGEQGATVNGEWPVQSLPADWDPDAVPLVKEAVA